jgi:hypothetical protein
MPWPSAAVRYAVEAAFLILVALAAMLARLEPIVIVALIAVAGVIVVLVERVFVRSAEPAPAKEVAPAEPSRNVELEDAGRAPVETAAEEKSVEPEPQAEPRAEPELAVSVRSARAILATGQPPVVEPPRARQEPEPKVERDPEPQRASASEQRSEAETVSEQRSETETEREPEPEPKPEPESVLSGPPREWSVWDLQRIAREHPEHPRQEEWTALILSLREFARADGMLPVDFDPLVRESFGGLLVAEPTQPETAAAP